MVMFANQPPYVVCILTPVVDGQLPVVSENRCQLKTGNRQLFFGLPFPSTPTQGRWGDELNT